MQEYRIITHFSDGVGNHNPWNAFIFEAEFEGQTPDDYIASNCGALDDSGLIAVGETEADAVHSLFKKQGLPKKNHDVADIFKKNSSFGPVYEPGYQPFKKLIGH